MNNPSFLPRGILLFLATISSVLSADSLTIVSPGDRAIFQRDAQNKAVVPITVETPEAASELRYRCLDQMSGAIVQDWKPLTQSKPGTWSASPQLPAGWYSLEVASKDATIPAIRFGVGEVFITAGQSNSANHGMPPQVAKEDRVSAMNWQTGVWQHAGDPEPGASGTGGSAWPALGDLLVAKYNVPVGFACVGVGSTSVVRWSPTFTHGTLFPHISGALEKLKPNGVRAILWHQGESDAINGTTPEAYAQLLTEIITESRKAAGYPVLWGVALASYHPDKKATPENQDKVVAGQKLVIANVAGVFQGASTNSFHERSLLYGGVHFNDAGLKEHGRLWFEALEPLLPKP